MSILVDGYNVLYAVGILSRGVGPHTLERARLALLNFLAESLEPAEAARTTVVFDAAEAPRDLPRVFRHRSLTVRFAVRHEDADALLEELIRADSAPKRLTVVSSDHRLQRAARRRRAKAVDSQAWWDELHRRRGRHKPPASSGPAKPSGPLSEEEVAFWLHQFGAAPEADSPPREPAVEHPVSEPPASEKPDRIDEIENPFPPGYAEDLLQEEDETETGDN